MTQETPNPERRLIEDYALLSSGNSAALVHRNGTIDWLCMPRFDSEAFFAGLLGDTRHGGWAMKPAHPEARVTRRYLPGTMVLETSVEAPSGRALILDFLAKPERGGPHELVRIVRGIEGSVDLHTSLRLRFNYGAWCPWVERRGRTTTAVAGPDAVRITAGVELVNADFATSSDFTVYASQTIPFVLEWYPSHEDPPVTRDAEALLERMVDEWREWSSVCSYDGPYRDAVERSLVTLKGLIYAPTGGIVAAATTSLPEMPGGVRNWDYRFCWLRDAAFVLYALAGSGFLKEAADWRAWLMRAIGGMPSDLQIMYGLRGERRLTEAELDWLPGFENSRPVRVGNAAHTQRQLDVYGAVIAAFHAARNAGLPDVEVGWPLECAMVASLEELWREPDAGIWEVRSEPKHFVHSKVMCWLAFDRMIAGAEQFGLSGPVDTWRRVRDEIHDDVCRNGFDAATNSFVQFYGSDRVDAALLLMPLTGFLPADDPRIAGTVARIERELMHDGLVCRYRGGETADGVPGSEGAFLACSFWLCSAYVAAGRRDEAHALFERLLALANDLGLYAEEYDPEAKRMLGNFPQAFSHVGLVNAAHALAREPGGAWELTHRHGSPPRS